MLKVKGVSVCASGSFLTREGRGPAALGGKGRGLVSGTSSGEPGGHLPVVDSLVPWGLDGRPAGAERRGFEAVSASEDICLKIVFVLELRWQVLGVGGTVDAVSLCCVGEGKSLSPYPLRLSSWDPVH